MNQNLASIVRARGLVLVLALLAFCQSLIAADYYISPTGNDSNGGTLASPFATIERARDVVRAQIAGGMTENITVHIGAGNYFIENAVVFDDRDAGRNGYTITYQGAPNLQSRIYGGRRITNWTQLSATQFSATVPDLQQHFTLYENDEAANGGLFRSFAGETKGNWARNGTTLTYYPRNLPIADQVVVLGTTKDVFIVKGRTNQQIVRNIVFDGLHMIGSDFTTSWPGGVTGFAAWTGVYDGVQFNNQAIGVIVPEARHGQFFVENAQNIVIRNSKLYGAGFMAVFFHRWAQNNRVENCWIENVGCTGIFFQGWEPGRGGSEGITTLEAAYCNKFNVVRNNVIRDIGRFQHDGAGVYLCWSGDNTIEHNIIKGVSRYGVSAKGWRPRMINQLYYWTFHPDEPGASGVGMPWDLGYPYGQTQITYYDGYVVTLENQGAELNHSRNNIIRYNDLSQIPRIGDDMGMIEQWGAGTNNLWAYNACHDSVNVAGWDNTWFMTLYVDDGSHQATLKGNILYWNASGGMASAIASKGNLQNNRYNIIADCEYNRSGMIGPFVEQAHHATWSNNIVASQISQLYTGFTGTDTLDGVNLPNVASAGDNVYFYQPLNRTDSSSAGASSLQSQVTANQSRDVNSVYADPQFDRQNPWWDAHHSDYKLKSTSPALARGFEETDMSQIGLRNDYPFPITGVLGQSAGKIRLAADYSRLLKVRVTNAQIQSRNGAPLPVNSWARYNDLDFEAGQFEQFQVRMQRATASQNNGPTIEVRLDAPDGELIGTIPSGLSTCRITPTTGRHDVFLVFPSGNVQTIDWFIFEARTLWTGNGSNNQWSTAGNWSQTITDKAPLYFGASSRLSPTNDLPAGSSFAGLGFDADAPAYNLIGNGISLTGDIMNQSANQQTIQMPLIFSSLGALRVDTGSAGMTLGGTLSGAASGICTELIKSGTGTLTLSGAFNFKGNITIENGTLTSLQPGIEDTATLSMNSLNGAALDLKHGLTERVARLYLNGVPMPDGTYGSSASAADYKDDSTFRGKGILLVQSGPTPPMLSTRADGFTVATFSGAGTGTWSVPPGVSQVEVLVVGGGGGGAKLSGGGGAGGLYHSNSYAVTPGAVIPITVGAGGAAGTGTGDGGEGGISQFGNQLLAYGGTRGLNSNAANGGNQGGYSLNGGTTIIPGKASTEPRAVGFWSGSGAGAAGTLGGSAAGGIGVASNITGQSRFYAGGGGSNAGGLGGSGIGGNGATAANASNATAGAPNTGSGGGGGNNGLSPNGGGSGIVIVAYQASPVTPTTTLLASSANPSNNGNDVTFTATVKANNITATDATGNYVFSLNGATVATVPIANGSASYTTNTLAPGPHFIQTIYYGDIQYEASGASLTQTNNSPYSPAEPEVSTRGDGYKVAKFTNTSLAYWQVPAGINKVEVLVVGGGGSGAAGSTWNADGGGGGGLTSLGAYDVMSGRLLPVTVGAGGAARTSTGAGNPGNTSSFDVITAAGGEGGLNARGGNSGGLNVNGVITSGGLGATNDGANGGGGAGQNGTGAYGSCPGGNGHQIAITGALTYYAGGGGGGYQGAGGLGGGGRGNYLNGNAGPGEAGANGLGGGGGASRDNPNSGKGGNGVVILAYPDPAMILTVSFESNGGSAIPSQTMGSGGMATPPPNPIKPGFMFGGWYPDVSLTSPFNFRTPITADTTLYAKWTIPSYTLTYQAAAGGSIVGMTTQTIGIGGSGTAVTAVPDSGYRFVKWSDDSIVNPRTDSNVTADISVTANFELLPPQIVPTSVFTRSDGKTVATFTSGNGEWTLPVGVTSVEVLVIGGGGGGGASTAFTNAGAGGGGAGGLIHIPNFPVSGGSISISVGGGGAGGAGGNVSGTNGSNSIFGDLTALGGGGGAGGNVVGKAGGSGGGSRIDPPVGGTAQQPGQPGLSGEFGFGNHGGAVNQAVGSPSGGGGGAGAAGSGITGGSGKSIDIIGAAVVYAGGGGGGGAQTSARGAGGLGGGGMGGNNTNPAVAGTPNTGGGGGGGNNAMVGASGGSGIVIVAYQTSADPYDIWAGPTGYNLTGDRHADDDGDGLSNFAEYAFGLDPTNGASSNPIAVSLDPTTKKFRYTRREGSGLTYTVETSTTLQQNDWTSPAAATQTVVETTAGVETVEVELLSLPSGDKLFVRVKAQ